MALFRGMRINEIKLDGALFSGILTVFIAFVAGFHTLVIQPISTLHESDITAQKAVNEHVVDQMEGNRETLKNIEVYQAKVGVHIETLAKSIDKLADKLEKTPEVQ